MIASLYYVCLVEAFTVATGSDKLSGGCITRGAASNIGLSQMLKLTSMSHG